MLIRCSISMLFLLGWRLIGVAQVSVDLKDFKHSGGVELRQREQSLELRWPLSGREKGRLVLDLENEKPLFRSIGLMTMPVRPVRSHGERVSGGLPVRDIAAGLDPVFLLTVGVRDLVSQNGWNIFFDKVPLKPHASFRVKLDKSHVAVRTAGTRTVIRIGEMSAPDFKGVLEITLYNGIALFNVAAVMSTGKDSTAILYDAGLVGKAGGWEHIAYADVNGRLQQVRPGDDSSRNVAVKYRTIIGEGRQGCLAVFPPPHQYFYPLDEAFNLRFAWYGPRYRDMADGVGLGIRQDLYGDHRYVPWFNAPPGTEQRMNFFCLLSGTGPSGTLAAVKRFTHNDKYLPLAGYKTMSSHFHNEYVMNEMMGKRAGAEVVANAKCGATGGPPGDAAAGGSSGGLRPDRSPPFVQVFRDLGIDIVHLAEFHYTAHPKGPDEERLKELQALFTLCRNSSSPDFLLLPGEEPNEFFGGHWLALFPGPVYWVMSGQGDRPFTEELAGYGKVYHIRDAGEMLELLEKEHGLAWTAHARTKGSVGYPDAYLQQPWFRSDRFLGAAWKAMPADLSQPRLGKRVLDLMDDLNNQGFSKKILSEADLFSVTTENEMYAHLNTNYLRLKQLPSFKTGWQEILDTLQRGAFFSTTGEVLIPAFTIDGKGTGDTVAAGGRPSTVSFTLNWTFPLNFAELVSGDGGHVYRDKINLDNTGPFGQQAFRVERDLSQRKWIRLEVWDAAANGAFTQTIWLR